MHCRTAGFSAGRRAALRKKTCRRSVLSRRHMGRSCPVFCSFPCWTKTILHCYSNVQLKLTNFIIKGWQFRCSSPAATASCRSAAKLKLKSQCKMLERGMGKHYIAKT